MVILTLAICTCNIYLSFFSLYFLNNLTCLNYQGKAVWEEDLFIKWKFYLVLYSQIGVFRHF